MSFSNISLWKGGFLVKHLAVITIANKNRYCGAYIIC